MKWKSKIATAVAWVLIPLLIGPFVWSVPAAAQVIPNEVRPTLPTAGERALTPRQYLYVNKGSDAKILDKIIWCESGWNPTAKNPGSSATGLAQFLDSTWVRTRSRMGADKDLSLRLDPYVHIDTLSWLYAHDGGVHWLESKSCWGNT